MKKCLIAITIMTTGCTAIAPQGGYSSSGEPAFKPQAIAYIDCNYANSVKIAKQNGDPLSLAVAASGMCSREASNLAQALAQQHGAATASQMMSNFEIKQVKANAAMIVNHRS